MNLRTQDTIRAPSGKDDVCVVFAIDAVDEPFVLHDIAEMGQQYTLSYYARSDTVGGITVSDTSMEIDTDWKRYVVTFIADSEDLELYFDYAGTYYLYNTQLEIGCKDTDFALNPADTEEDVDNLTVTVNSHTTQLTVVDGQINALVADNSTLHGEYDTLVVRSTEIEADLSGISTRVSLAETDLLSMDTRMSAAESTLIQHADEIDLRVTKDGVIGAINLSSEEVKISAEKITLEGATIADSFTATNLHITGNSVFDGTLNGATGTFAGSLSAASGTFAGALSGATGDFSGKITATSGKIGDWNIGGAITATNSNGNYIYLGAGTSANQDVLFVRTGTDSSSYKWPIILRATGEAIFSNANITGSITATSIKLSDTVSIYKPSISQYVTLINQASENINLGLMYSSLTTPNIVSTGSVWAQSTTYGGQFNAVSGDYGVMLRNDGNAFYILLSNAGNQTSFNSLRPFAIGLTDGKVSVATEFWCSSYGVSGTRRPVVSASTDGTRTAYIASKVNSSGTYYLTVNGQYGTTGSDYNSHNINCTTSDVRLKTNILDTDITALPVINQMQVRQFDWKENGIHQRIGFVADELEVIDPALAIGGGYDEDGNMDIKSVNEFYLAGYLTKGIQELYDMQLAMDDELLTIKTEQDSHWTVIEQLLDENATLKKRIEQLEQQIA